MKTRIDLKRKLNKRGTSVFIAMLLACVILIGRLVQIQIINYKEYQSLSIGQFTKEVTISAKRGTIYDANGRQLGRLQVVDFADYQTQLVKTTGNVFLAPNGGAVDSDAKVVNKALEGSNVDAVDQMVQMMSSQRALQSSSQVLKMYDSIMEKMVSRLGPV